MVAITGSIPVLIAVNAGIAELDPLAARPIDGALLVQEYVVVPTVLFVVKVISEVVWLLHNS